MIDKEFKKFVLDPSGDVAIQIEQSEGDNEITDGKTINDLKNDVFTSEGKVRVINTF